MAMSPERRERTAQMRKRQIISAALELFDKKGYAKTTIDDIAESAQISKGLVYKYYASKHDILLAFHQEVLNREAADYASLSAIEAIQLFTSRLLEEFDVTGRDAAPLRSLLIAALNGEIAPHAKENYFTNGYGPDFFAPLIRKAQADGDFRAGDPEILADMYWHMLIGYALHITHDHPDNIPDISAMVDILRGKKR